MCLLLVYKTGLSSSLCHGEIIAMLRRWFVESNNIVNVSLVIIITY